MKKVIIDVREKDEFDAEHVQNSIHIPLSSFERQAPAILNTLKDHQIVLMCQSGKRAGLASDAAKRLCSDVTCEVFTGGISEWKNQGHPTVAAKKAHLPIIRQVQLIAGSMVFAGTLLAYLVDSRFLFLTGFVGLGLMVAGATGFCGMAELLARLPWNKSYPEKEAELCAVSPGSSHCSKS